MGLNPSNTTGTPDRVDGDGRKYFTAEQANAALPLVRRIVGDIVSQHRTVMDHHARLQAHGLSDAVVERVDGARLLAADRLNELVTELHDVGCELKDWETGLVDFPAQMNGREVCLCWKLGESQVAFWHEVRAGFSGRQALAAAEQ